MSCVTYSVYKDLGYKLSETHVGREVIRTFPRKIGEGQFSFDCMTTYIGRIDTAKATLISAGDLFVVVKKSGYELIMPNDGNWLLVEDFVHKTKTAAAVTMDIIKTQEHS